MNGRRISRGGKGFIVEAFRRSETAAKRLARRERLAWTHTTEAGGYYVIRPTHPVTGLPIYPTAAEGKGDAA